MAIAMIVEQNLTLYFLINAQNAVQQTLIIE
jgi:hypothetical protein